jgi:hypothetical protein
MSKLSKAPASNVETVDSAGVKAGNAYRIRSRSVAPKLAKRVASLMMFYPL